MTGHDRSVISHKERLGQAIKWMDQQVMDDHKVVEEACRRFDLSPADEEFLHQMWRERNKG